MVSDNDFTLIMLFIGKWEWSNRPDGAYTNDPEDPGGETKFGISARAFPSEDIRNLTLDSALKHYYDRYWSYATLYDHPLDWAIMDSSVNLGVSAAKRILRQGDTYKQYNTSRMIYYNRLANKKPALKKFLNGWLNRVNDLNKFIEIHASL